MARRILMLFCLLLFPIVLTGCPGEDDTIQDQLEEGVEEVVDEIDDAL